MEEFQLRNEAARLFAGTDLARRIHKFGFDYLRVDELRAIQEAADGDLRERVMQCSP